MTNLEDVSGIVAGLHVEHTLGIDVDVVDVLLVAFQIDHFPVELQIRTEYVASERETLMKIY